VCHSAPRNKTATPFRPTFPVSANGALNDFNDFALAQPMHYNSIMNANTINQEDSMTYDTLAQLDAAAGILSALMDDSATLPLERTAYAVTRKHLNEVITHLSVKSLRKEQS